MVLIRRVPVAGGILESVGLKKVCDKRYDQCAPAFRLFPYYSLFPPGNKIGQLSAQLPLTLWPAMNSNSSSVILHLGLESAVTEIIGKTGTDMSRLISCVQIHWDLKQPHSL